MNETTGSNSGATTETVVTASGQDWDDIVTAAARQRTGEAERIVVNMGPQHPSTHGVLRLILEIEGETVVEARCGIGYLHTGIEKNLEYRNWTQGVTFVTRMDYLSPFFNETAYCLGVEKLSRHHRRHSRASHRHSRDDDGAQSNLVAPCRPGNRWNGTGRRDGDAVRIPRTRIDSGRVRDDHRTADESRLHQAWWSRSGSTRRVGREGTRTVEGPTETVA